jgi:hypothetical protein
VTQLPDGGVKVAHKSLESLTKLRDGLRDNGVPAEIVPITDDCHDPALQGEHVSKPPLLDKPDLWLSFYIKPRKGETTFLAGRYEKVHGKKAIRLVWAIATGPVRCLPA